MPNISTSIINVVNFYWMCVFMDNAACTCTCNAQPQDERNIAFTAWIYLHSMIFSRARSEDPNEMPHDGSTQFVN